MPALRGNSLDVNIGTRDMLSTPAAITTSCMPDITACAAKCSACCDDPHWRSMEVPGTDSGSKRDASTALRATLVDCSPTWLTQPSSTSSTAAGSMPVRSTSASSTSAARSAGMPPGEAAVAAAGGGAEGGDDLMAINAGSEQAAMRPASAMASGISASLATTRDTRP
jgi:hypothetical protein